MESRIFYSHGKLLISGEYLVLDGASALAVPVRPGQSLLVEECAWPGLHWIALQPTGTWFEARFGLPGFEIQESTDTVIAATLKLMLESTRHLKEDFLMNGRNIRVSTRLEFNRDWGLGSSSTLLAGLAAWAGIDPFKLHALVSKGSGYDIACALAPGPLVYRLEDDQPVVKPVKFQPWFRESIYFVYLGRKQDSNAGISDYRRKKLPSKGTRIQISKLTEAMLSAVSMEEFGLIMEEHEAIISNILEVPMLQDTVFKGFPGTVKSLGAWGGDFAMLASDIGEPEVRDQLLKHGLTTCFGFDELLVQYPGKSPV